MASGGWLVSAKINFSSNGKAVMEALQKSAVALEKTLEKLTVTTAKTSAAIDGLAASATRAAGAVSDLNAAASRTGAATAGAAAGAQRAGTSYAGMATAANAATAAILRLNAAQRFGILGASRQAVLGPAPMFSSAASRTAQMFGGSLALSEASAAFAPRAQRALTGEERLALGPGVDGNEIVGMPPRQGGSGRGYTGGYGFPSGPPAGGGGGRGGGWYLGPHAVPGGIGAASAAAAAMQVSVPGFVAHAARHAAVIGLESLVGTASDAVYEAGKLQQRMTIMRVASPGLIGNTPANNAMMARAQEEAYNISNATAQSVAQSAELMAIMTSSGVPLNQLMQRGKNKETFAMDVAKFADVQYLKTGGKTSFAQGTSEGIQLAHLYQAYTPDKIAKILDTVTKLSFMMPDNLSKFLTQQSYFAPTLTRLGVPQDESLMLGAFLDRMGLGRGKGGTAVNNFVAALLKPIGITGHQQKGQIAALQDLGIYSSKGVPNPRIFMADEHGDSKISVIAALQEINRSIDTKIKPLQGEARAAEERKLINEFRSAFQITGARFGLLGTDAGVKQLLQMLGQVKTAPGVDAGQSLFMRNINSQTVRVWSNFQSLMTEIGTQAIPGLTHGLLDLGNALSYARSWLNKNKDLEIAMQKWVSTTVNETEKWLKSHEKDFKELGKDLLNAGIQISKMGPAVKSLADDAVSLAKGIDDVNKAITRFFSFISSFRLPGQIKPGEPGYEAYLRGTGLTPAQAHPDTPLHKWLTTPPKPVTNTAADAFWNLIHAVDPVTSRIHEAKKTSAVQSHTTVHVGQVILQLPHGATGDDARKLLADLGKPRSIMASAPSHHSIPLVLQTGLG